MLSDPPKIFWDDAVIFGKKFGSYFSFAKKLQSLLKKTPFWKNGAPSQKYFLANVKKLV